MASPMRAIATSATICAIARMVFPMTLPARSARTGMAEIRISTTRVCFSSTTLCAIVPPNMLAAMRNTTPKPIATR
jgi:hypothetical protein